jgi:hypothetical protein
MKKNNKLIFSILIIVIILISFIVVLFMFDNEPTLIGSWKGETEGGILIFRENGAIEIRSTGAEENGISGNYIVKGNIINVTFTITIVEEEIISWEMEYEFLSYNRLKLAYLGDGTDASIEYYQRL